MIKKLYRLIRRYLRGAENRQITLYSASGSFYIFISIIPSLVLLSSVLPLSQWNQDEVNQIIRMVVPDTVTGLLENLVNQVYAYSGSIWSVSAIFTLWSASKVISSLLRGIIRASGSEKSTAYIRLTLKAMGYAVLMLLSIYVLMLASVVLNVLGVFEIHVLQNSKLLFSLILCLLLTAAYHIIPGRKRAYRFSFPGAILASGVWMLFNYFYSLWLNFSDRYGVYGTIGSVMISLLWLYVSLYIVFSGAYVNCFLHEIFLELKGKKLYLLKKPRPTWMSDELAEYEQEEEDTISDR